MEKDEKSSLLPRFYFESDTSRRDIWSDADENISREEENQSEIVTYRSNRRHSPTGEICVINLEWLLKLGQILHHSRHLSWERSLNLDQAPVMPE